MTATRGSPSASIQCCVNQPQSQDRSHIIVLGNEKGGSGKSTMAAHLIVALLKRGFKVGSLDLDARQGTLSRLLETRRIPESEAERSELSSLERVRAAPVLELRRGRKLDWEGIGRWPGSPSGRLRSRSWKCLQPIRRP